jgi:thiamine transport system permease protein
MLPSIVTAMMFALVGNALGGFNPIAAIIAANVFSNYSLIVRSVGSQWQTIDHASEEAAALSGAGRLRTAISISLPQLRSSILSSAAMTMLYCLSSYGIVLALSGGNVNTIETEIGIAALQHLDIPRAAALSILQVILCVAFFLISRSNSDASLSLAGSEMKVSPRLDRRDAPATALFVAVVGFLILLPMLWLLARAFIVDGHFSIGGFELLNSLGVRNLLDISVIDATLNSLRNLCVATVIAAPIGLFVSFLMATRAKAQLGKPKKRDVLGATIDSLFMLPIGVSSVVLALGYLITFGDGWLPLRSSWLVVPLVQALLATPLVVRIVYPALMAIEDTVHAHAQTEGATQWQIFVRLDLRIISAAVRTAIAFAALVSLGEFGAASLLSFGDQSTLTVLLYQLISRPGGQNYQMALSIAAMLVTLTIVTVLLVSRDSKTQREH